MSAIELPPPLDSEAARSAVVNWAKGKLFFSATRWQGCEIETESQNLIRGRVTRMIEYRSESHEYWTHAQGVPPLGSYSGDIGSVSVPRAETFESRSWHLLLNGSLGTNPCPNSSCVKGSVKCDSCNGRGWNPCSSCHGTGVFSMPNYTPQGRRYVTRNRCTSCAGRGGKDCWHCSNGWNQCSSCAGYGTVIVGFVGSIRQVPESKDFGGVPPVEWRIKPKKLQSSDWSLEFRSDGASLPDGISAALSSSLWDELGRTWQGEHLKKVELMVLPVTRVVRKGMNDPADARIVGVNRRVFANGCRSRKRIGLAIGALLMAATIALVASQPRSSATDPEPSVIQAPSGQASVSEEEAMAGVKRTLDSVVSASEGQTAVLKNCESDSECDLAAFDDQLSAFSDLSAALETLASSSSSSCSQTASSARQAVDAWIAESENVATISRSELDADAVAAKSTALGEGFRELKSACNW